MAQSRVTPANTVHLELVLTEHEARALMAMMQNPLHGDPAYEPEADRNVRCVIFDTLHAHFYGNQRGKSHEVPEGPDLTGWREYSSEIGAGY